MMDSSENENELNVNESVIEKDVEGLEENVNFQTKNNVVKGNEKESIQASFEKLYVQTRT
jgi:hypothetical protein